MNYREAAVWARKVLRRRARVRLAGEITTFELELSARANGPHLTPVYRALDRAKDANSLGLVDQAWRCLHAARRLEIWTLGAPAVQALGAAINKESGKISGWRRETIVGLLTPQAGQSLPTENIVRAAEIRDAYYDNEAYKDSLRRGSALRMAIALAGGLVVLLLLVALGSFADAICSIDAFAKGEKPTGPAACGANELYSTFWSVLVLGFLGAAVSAITDMPAAQNSSRIPELTSTVRVTVLRLLIGPTSAIVLFFLLHSELYKTFFNVTPSGYTMMLIAFAAGFSERLVLRVISTIVNGATNPPAKGQ